MSTSALQRAVIVMAKRPAPGVTKTRLTPMLSNRQAADLYERFLLDTLVAVSSRADCTTVIAIDASESAAYFSAIAPGVMQVLQTGENLGDRLDAVLSHCVEAGFEQVFALGSDSPDLPAGHLDAAVAALDHPDTDLVFGPSDDGGYYLIGWKRRHARVVTGVAMSTQRVLTDSLAIADELGLVVELAPGWYDVDEPEDLDRLRASLAGSLTSHTAQLLATL